MATFFFLNTVTSLLVAIFVIVGLKERMARTQEVLRQWAQTNGYTILERENRSPYQVLFSSSIKKETVYWVQIQEANGQVRAGIVRWNEGPSAGNLNQIQVQWEE